MHTILFSLLVLATPMIGMESAKNFIKKIGYHIMPASWNPRNLFRDHYHKVEDKVFRSKTMSYTSLAKHIEDDTIQGILILRERGLNDYWLRAEKNVADNLGVKIHHVQLNARVFPSQKKLQKIYEILKEYKEQGKALLIHCVAGVDRTGEISGVRKLMEGKSADEALGQLVWYPYGHLEWRFPHCRETVRQLAELQQQYGSLEEAIKHFPARPFNPPSLPVRAFNSLRDTISDAVKKNPKTACAFAGLSIAGVAAFYAHKKNKLMPALQALKAKISGQNS